MDLSLGQSRLRLPARPALSLPKRILPRAGRARVALLALLLALPALGGAWMWLRDSSLVAVERVQISGAHGPQAREIELALRDAAERESTLHVRVGALRAAVAAYPVVRDVRATTSFPHGLRIEVLERPPVAALQVAGARTAVAADGVVLGPSLLRSSLPQLKGVAADPLSGGRVKNASELAALTVLGAAPATLSGWVARVFEGREGLTVAMRNGLLLYFGDATRPHAKWASAARVLADSSSAGAWYVDVRLPQRPAAGLPAGSAHGTSEEASGEALGGETGTSDPTAAALAASLARAVEPEASASTPAGAGSTSSEPASSSPATPEGASGNSANAPSMSSETSSSTGSEVGAGGAAGEAAAAPVRGG